MQNENIYVLGYDPGGDGKHGVAVLQLQDGKPHKLETDTLDCAEEVLKFFSAQSKVLAIGIDTILCWSTSKAGWRPADRWLRNSYPDVLNSIAAPNSLYGSMGLNGPAVLLEIQRMHPDILAVETHPKVLYWHLTKERYGYEENRKSMDSLLANLVNLKIETDSDHAWDAALSAIAAYKGLTGEWSKDLHALTPSTNERLVWPCKNVHYFWPVSPS